MFRWVMCFDIKIVMFWPYPQAWKVTVYKNKIMDFNHLKLFTALQISANYHENSWLSVIAVVMVKCPGKLLLDALESLINILELWSCLSVWTVRVIDTDNLLST